MILDVRTMGIISAVTPLILGVMMLVYLRERKVYGGFGRWVLANFGLGLAYTFLTLRDFIPGFVSVVLGNVILAYCVILIYEGIELFYARPAFSLTNYLILGVYSCLQIYFTYVVPDINMRVIFSSLVLFILNFRAGKRLLQGSIPELRGTSRAAGVVFIVTALFPLYRSGSALLEPEPILFFSDNINSWFSIVFIASIVSWTFFFFFLNSARLELELETARARLDLIARTDPLTRLYNRRHFDEHAELEFQRARRFGYTISFLMLDVDHFKTINDSHGHGSGDAVLLSLSEVIRLAIRPFDLVARLGGDEFIVMLMDTSPEQAYSIAERIRSLVAQTALGHNVEPYHVTLSVGMTTVQPGDGDLKRILKRTDEALYLAKQQGRNCVRVA